MNLSYAVTVCNELKEIKTLLPFLLENKREEDEIVVLLDEFHGSLEVLDYLNSLPGIKLYKDTFKNHFAEWKNKLNSYCSGDYIFQLDADESCDVFLLKTIPSMVSMNLEVDVFLLPRINIVNGITEEHIKKWGWNIDSNRRINHPDWQWRLYRNSPDIKWVNKVHERLDGFKTYTFLPQEEKYALIHIKDITKQEKQNNFYSTL